MTRSIFALLATFFIALGAQFGYAQPGGEMQMNPEQQIKELISQLDVSAEQEPAFREAMAQVNAMRMENMGQMRGMREGQGRGQGKGQSADAAHDGQGHGQDADADADAAHGAGRGQADSNAGEAGRGMAMMAQRRAEMAEKTEAILAPVLSGAQLAKYKELDAARMEKMMSRMRQ
jgi:hypothetical protein